MSVELLMFSDTNGLSFNRIKSQYSTSTNTFIELHTPVRIVSVVNVIIHYSINF